MLQELGCPAEWCLLVSGLQWEKSRAPVRYPHRTTAQPPNASSCSPLHHILQRSS